MFQSPGATDVLCFAWGGGGSVEGLLVDPHEGPRLVGLALVLDAAELVAELAVLPLVVVVVFGLPDRLKRPRFDKLGHRKNLLFSFCFQFCSFNLI